MGNVPVSMEITETSMESNDTPAPTIREQTENTKHLLMGGRDETNGYLNSKQRPVPQNRDRKVIHTFLMLQSGTTNRTYDSNIAEEPILIKVVSKVDRYNSGNHSLGSELKILLLSNTPCKPNQLYNNVPKAAPTMQAK